MGMKSCCWANKVLSGRAFSRTGSGSELDSPRQVQSLLTVKRLGVCVGFCLNAVDLNSAVYQFIFVNGALSAIS